jgi:hypothetical protein
MAQKDYITVSDITHVHLKQFPVEILEQYVDSANDHYEDVVLALGVSVTNLIDPIPVICKRYLNAFLCTQFALDSISTNNVTVTQDDMYSRMADKFEEVQMKLRKQITPELVRGVSGNSRKSLSVSTGKLWRTA